MNGMDHNSIYGNTGFTDVSYIEEILFPSEPHVHSPSQITPQMPDGPPHTDESPPQSTPQFQASSKPPNKRKRQTVVPDQSIGVVWDKYESPSIQHAMLYEDLFPMCGTFTLGVRHIDKNIQPTPDAKSWIVYRQNQFKLQCYLTGSLQHYTTPVVSVEDIPQSRSPTRLFVRSNNNVHRVEGLYFYLYAIKQHEEENVITDEQKIALHQVGPSRTKKETKAPDLLPIVEGEAMFDKLQFQASTSVGGHAYFRVITRLVCKSTEGIRVIASQISPKMIVRAQNPGRYTSPKQINNIPNTAVHTNFTSISHNSSSSGLSSMSGMSSMNGLPSSMSVPTMSTSSAGPATSGGVQHSIVPQKAIMNGSSSNPMMSPFGILPHIFSSNPANQAPVFSPPDHVINIPRNTPWLMTREVVYHHGKVGINTNSPPEALSVQGNILVTGDILKPSDRRLKQNFMRVDTSAQMTSIENIKIYDYDVMADNAVKRERGVIAQELQKIIPEAVRHLGDVSVGNQTIDNLLVVNERMLLLENIGATQHLDKVVKREQAELEFVNNKVKELEEEENKTASSVLRAMHNMLGLIMDEDFRESSEDECLYCGISLLGLGPAWTLYILGFFFPPTWVLGTLYAFSKSRSKRTAGFANVLMIMLVTCIILIITNSGRGILYVALLIGVVVTGIVFVTFVSYYRKKRQRLRANVWKRLRELMKEARNEEHKRDSGGRVNQERNAARAAHGTQPEQTDMAQPHEQEQEQEQDPSPIAAIDTTTTQNANAAMPGTTTTITDTTIELDSERDSDSKQQAPFPGTQDPTLDHSGLNMYVL